MAHFQERRAGGDRRQQKDGDRRINPDRRSDTNDSNIKFIEQARHKAWLVMTDKNIEGQ